MFLVVQMFEATRLVARDDFLNSLLLDWYAKFQRQSGRLWQRPSFPAGSALAFLR